MEAAPEDDAARLRFYARLADAELFVLLRAESEGERIDPEIFDTAEGRLVPVFDLEERLGAFTGAPAPYAALSGRAAAMMLEGQGLGIALNPGVAPSAMVLPAQAIDWLAETLREAPAERLARARALSAPGGLPQILLQALDTKLAGAGGLAQIAYLCGVTYETGAVGHLLAFVGAAPEAEAALARAVREALVFSGLDAGEIDVGFFAPSDPVAARLARTGLRFDLPKAHLRTEKRDGERTGPGMDPQKPPRLR
ncbi:SseB family protein [Profundibacterium mesophilum]|nr:SseB family protein [Profundibacterium mesophilum]